MTQQMRDRLYAAKQQYDSYVSPPQNLRATLNAAGIRPRMPLILDWLAVNEPDVLAIQETKVEDEKFPLDDFEELGYHAAVHGQKSWNGVATLSRHAIQNARMFALLERPAT